MDFVYPPRCLVCGEWMDKWSAVCARCAERFEWLDHPMCPICGRPFESAPYDHPCGSCAVKAPPFDALRSAAFYEDSMRETILRFKFSSRTSLVKPLGSALVEVFEKEFGDMGIDSVIPVPLHPSRLRWRGYNQSLLLARYIGRSADMWVDAYSLNRIRATVPQVELPPKQRALNVKGAFAVSRKRLVDGRRILLVDDLNTTGATLQECAKILKKTGASKVYALTVARPRQ